MWEAVEHVRDHDAPEAVDVDSQAKRTIHDAVASEEEDDPERLQERGSEQGQERNGAEQLLQLDSALTRLNTREEPVRAE